MVSVDEPRVMYPPPAMVTVLNTLSTFMLTLALLIVTLAESGGTTPPAQRLELLKSTVEPLVLTVIYVLGCAQDTLVVADNTQKANSIRIDCSTNRLNGVIV